jgi:capsular exopolysaccharide synthesis family protein
MSKTADPALTIPDYEQKAALTLLNNVIQKTEITGLDIITSGPASENPAELLGTVQTQSLIHLLSQELSYDVIIVDTPPTLSVSDTSILANLIDAHVALVVESGRTRRAATSHALQQLTNLSIDVAGIVLNRANLRDTEASYGYYYGYYDYDSRDQEPRLRTNGQRPTPAIPTSSVARRVPAPVGKDEE